MVGEEGLEPSRIATLDPKFSGIRSYAGFGTFDEFTGIHRKIAESPML